MFGVKLPSRPPRSRTRRPEGRTPALVWIDWLRGNRDLLTVTQNTQQLLERSSHNHPDEIRNRSACNCAAFGAITNAAIPDTTKRRLCTAVPIATLKSWISIMRMCHATPDDQPVTSRSPVPTDAISDNDNVRTHQLRMPSTMSKLNLSFTENGPNNRGLRSAIAALLVFAAITMSMAFARVLFWSKISGN